jgi:O-antigen/teichoic acid export membrane protein
LIGCIITIIINVTLIPVYGYMASAWAHVAAYGAMIVMSFIFAEKHYKIKYNMKELIPYFAMAVGMVLISRMVIYKNLIWELVINTFMILLFIFYAQFKDKTINILFKKNQ